MGGKKLAHKSYVQVILNLLAFSDYSTGTKQTHNIHTDITSYRLNWPRVIFIEKANLINFIFLVPGLYPTLDAELEKAGSLDFAEPDFLKIRRKISPVFHQIFIKFYNILQNVTNLTNFNKKKHCKFHKIFTKLVIDAVLLQFQIVVIYAFFP